MNDKFVIRKNKYLKINFLTRELILFFFVDTFILDKRENKYFQTKHFLILEPNSYFLFYDI